MKSARLCPFGDESFQPRPIRLQPRGWRKPSSADEGGNTKGRQREIPSEKNKKENGLQRICGNLYCKIDCKSSVLVIGEKQDSCPVQIRELHPNLESFERSTGRYRGTRVLGGLLKAAAAKDDDIVAFDDCGSLKSWWMLVFCSGLGIQIVGSLEPRGKDKARKGPSKG